MFRWTPPASPGTELGIVAGGGPASSGLAKGRGCRTSYYVPPTSQAKTPVASEATQRRKQLIHQQRTNDGAHAENVAAASWAPSSPAERPSCPALFQFRPTIRPILPLPRPSKWAELLVLVQPHWLLDIRFYTTLLPVSPTFPALSPCSRAPIGQLAGKGALTSSHYPSTGGASCSLPRMNSHTSPVRYSHLWAHASPGRRGILSQPLRFAAGVACRRGYVK